MIRGAPEPAHGGEVARRAAGVAGQGGAGQAPWGHVQASAAAAPHSKTPCPGKGGQGRPGASQEAKGRSRSKERQEARAN